MIYVTSNSSAFLYFYFKYSVLVFYENVHYTSCSVQMAVMMVRGKPSGPISRYCLAGTKVNN
jgi:hypothetical protein